MKTVLLKNIEKEYRQGIESHIIIEKDLNPNNFIELSEMFFESIKVKGIETEEDEDNDMLLFQYGTYNWGGELGEHFSFDITRQFIKKNFDMYQLSFTLIFDPIHFTALESYNSWSSDFENIDKWIENIKSTKGYEEVLKHPFRIYKLGFTRL